MPARAVMENAYLRAQGLQLFLFLGHILFSFLQFLLEFFFGLHCLLHYFSSLSVRHLGIAACQLAPCGSFSVRAIAGTVCLCVCVIVVTSSSSRNQGVYRMGKLGKMKEVLPKAVCSVLAWRQRWLAEWTWSGWWWQYPGRWRTSILSGCRMSIFCLMLWVLAITSRTVWAKRSIVASRPPTLLSLQEESLTPFFSLSFGSWSCCDRYGNRVVMHGRAGSLASERDSCVWVAPSEGHDRL